MIKIAIGCDHIVVQLKSEIIKYLEQFHFEVIDCGTSTQTRTHYPIFALKVAKCLEEQKATHGIVLCGTGIGITSAVSKFQNIRCALVYDEIMCKRARETLDINVIGLGGRISGLGVIEDIIDAFLTTPYRNLNNQTISKINNIACLNANSVQIADLLNFEEKI